MSAYPFDVLVNSGSIGGNGGGEVGILANTGGLVERVGVWASGRDIIGVSVKFTNDEEKKQMGSGKWGDYSEFIFEAAETVKSLSLWGNGKGTNLGRIKFTTSTGRSFDCGGHNGKEEFPQDVGSGLWVGIKGNCGGTVDMMGVYFLKKVDSMSMKDVKFKNDPTGTSKGIKAKSVKSTKFPWQGKAYDYKFDQPRLEKESHTVTETNSQATSLALGFREMWKGEVNLYFTKTDLELEATENIEHTWTKEKSTADSTETTEGVTSGASGHIGGPDDGVIVEAVTYAGQLDLEYTATIVVKMASGATYNIPTKGTMKKVAYSKIYMNVRPISEDTTLPPGEESRSADYQQFDASLEDRAAYEQPQDEEPAWSPRDEEHDQYNQYNTNPSENHNDGPYENLDERWGQKEEIQGSSEWQQDQEYDRPEDEPRISGWQEQENNEHESENENEERSYSRRNQETEDRLLEDEQQEYQTADRWNNDQENNDYNNEAETEEQSYNRKEQENEQQIQDEQDDLRSERWNQDQDYDNRDIAEERRSYNRRDEEDEQQENLSSDRWNQDEEYNVRSNEDEENSYNRRNQTNEDEQEENRQVSRWNQDQINDNQNYGLNDEERNSNRTRFQNERDGNYTTSRSQNEERYSEEQAEYRRGYEA